MKSFKIIILLIIPILINSCNEPSRPKANPNIPPKFVETPPTFAKHGELNFINNKSDTISTIEIEIAETPNNIEKGLMYRKSMEYNRGMLFIFEDETRRSFWMKNTHIPLDIIFINAEKEIVHIAENTIPYSLRSVPSYEYAMFVVEVNAGYCKNKGILTGHKIDFIRL